MNNVNQDIASNKKGLDDFVNEDVFQLNKFEQPNRETSVKPKKFLTRMKDVLFLLIGIRDFDDQNMKNSKVELATSVEGNHSILKSRFEKIKGKVRKKAFRYPWVVGISAVLAVSFLMIRLIKPTRKVLKYLK